MLAKRQLINSSIGLDWAVVLTVLGRSIINSVVFCVAGSKAIQDTVVCRIVRRLLISVHKWQFTGMADTHEY